MNATIARPMYGATSAVTRAASVANAVNGTIPSAIDRTIVAHTRSGIRSSPLPAVRSSRFGGRPRDSCGDEGPPLAGFAGHGRLAGLRRRIGRDAVVVRPPELRPSPPLRARGAFDPGVDRDR